jgi:hypothetical protein
LADTEIQTILRDLLARTDLSTDTREELKEFQTQAQGAGLDRTDRDYVLALARRLTGTAVGGAVADSDTLDHHDYDEEHSWRERAQEAEQRAAAAEAKLAEIKDAFERLYGPAAAAPGPEADIRREVYETFSRELERIEKGGHGS